MNYQFYIKLRAAFIHLMCSTGLALVAVAIIYGIWYPQPVDKAVGVSRMVLLLLSIDVVAGACLTFVVYKRGKKTLVFDLAVIVVMQLGAFLYGMHAIAQGRPAWLVFNADRFDVARVNELDDRYLNDTKAEYASPSWTGPRWVASVNPSDTEKRNKLIFESAGGGFDLPQRPDLYQPIESAKEAIKSRTKPLDGLREFNAAERVQEEISQWPQADGWLPLMSRNQPMVVLIEKGQPIAIVDLIPWN